MKILLVACCLFCNCLIASELNSCHLLFAHEIGKTNTIKEITDVSVVAAIPPDSLYKHFLGNGAYLNERYCLALDYRFGNKLHKIDMQTGKPMQQFVMDEKQWAEKIYGVLYNGDKSKISKSVKSRRLYIKKDRLFDKQEFELENITVKNHHTILSLRFHFPDIGNVNDTIGLTTKVLFELNDSLQITDYWVAPTQQLENGFYILPNTDRTSLLLMGDTVYLPVDHIHYDDRLSPKYKYAKFLLSNNHTITLHSYLPFTIPEVKGAVTGNYNVPHMYLVNLGEQIAGSYITFPSIYNLTTNTKISDLALLGFHNQPKNKRDSILFDKDINNLDFAVNYFERYKDKYYLMQCRNGLWSIFILFDDELNSIKTVYFSPITHDKGRAFYTQDDSIYFLKFGTKGESDMHIVKWSISNIFSMEIE
jgi:hypothetical protein